MIASYVSGYAESSLVLNNESQKNSIGEAIVFFTVRFIKGMFDHHVIIT